MAKAKNNIVTHGLSGKLGDLLVFSQRSGKTFVSKAPGERSGQLTEAQLGVQSKFQQAVIYAKAAIADSATKAAYASAAKEGLSAYNVAIADFFNAPDIHEIDISQYTGSVNSTIKIRVTDDFEVKTVHVNITNSDGSLVEEGGAVQEPDGIHWVYTATAENVSLDGDKISVSATDRPSNNARHQTTIDH